MPWYSPLEAEYHAVREKKLPAETRKNILKPISTFFVPPGLFSSQLIVLDLSSVLQFCSVITLPWLTGLHHHFLLIVMKRSIK